MTPFKWVDLDMESDHALIQALYFTTASVFATQPWIASKETSHASGFTIISRSLPHSAPHLVCLLPFVYGLV
jgi:hypothetical protein